MSCVCRTWSEEHRAEIRVGGRFGWWDALPLATAERHGWEFVLSEDMQDGVRLGAVSVLDPFVGDELPAVAGLLR